MPTLAAVLVVAAIGSLRVGDVETVWRTGGSSQIAMVTTFLATLFLPVAAAVGLGVALSLLLQLNADAMDLRVVALRRLPDGGIEEGPAPSALASRTVAVLDVYGSLLYAGARTLEARLPNPADADVAAVVLRLRGRSHLGATAFTVLRNYADRLGQRGGRLYLSGVDPMVIESFQRTGHMVDGWTAGDGSSRLEAGRVDRGGFRRGSGLDCGPRSRRQCERKRQWSTNR